jgi:hypothetical protein
VAERTAELQRDLDGLVAGAEAAVLPTGRRLGRRAGIAGLAVAGILGLGTAAVAAGIIDAPADWLRSDRTLSSGTTCQVAYGVMPQADPNLLSSVPPAERAPALAAAREFVRTFDLSTISVPAAIEKWKASVARARAESARKYAAMSPAEQAAVRKKGGPHDFGPALVGDELELRAVSFELYSLLSVELRREGLNPDAVSMGDTSRCPTQAPSAPDGAAQ